MGRTKGSNNQNKQPAEFDLHVENRIALLADILFEIATEDLENEQSEGSCPNLQTNLL